MTVKEEASYKKILVPIDGSNSTKPIVKKAIKTAKANNSHLDFLNVMEVNKFNKNYSAVVSDETVYKLTNKIQKQLEDLKQEALKAGVKSASVHIRYGNPKSIIAQEFPTEHNDDLIILGSTGLSAVQQLLVGSVTNYVTQTSKQDVLLVKS